MGTGGAYLLGGGVPLLGQLGRENLVLLLTASLVWPTDRKKSDEIIT